VEIVLEGVLTVAAYLIYGTDAHPRHPALRNVARLNAFGGLVVAIAWVSFWPHVTAPPMYVTLPWMLTGLTVLLAEYDLGSKRLAYLSMAGSALLIGIALFQTLR
jgi:hypothetical protein